MPQTATTSNRSNKVILVHGFNVRDKGERTVNKLRPYLELSGFKVVPFTYGWLGLFGVRFLTRAIALRLASLINPGDVAIGHSNGANVINRAAWEYSAPFGSVFYINPALDRDMPLAPQIYKGYVYHTPKDKVVRLSTLLPAHDWGDMGAVGYQGPQQSRYHNINTAVEGHSAIFKHPEWLKHVASEVRADYALRFLFHRRQEEAECLTR